MAKKLADLVFLAAILLVLTAGLVTALLFPDAVNTYENRYANRMPALTLSGWMDGSFQQGVDDALSDQVNFASYAKRLFNIAKTGSLLPMVEPLAQAHPQRYFNYQTCRLFGGDHFVYYPRPLYLTADALNAKAANYNETFARLPGVEFYIYFIEKDTDIDFETGEKTLAWETLRDALELPEDRMARFAVDDFDRFSRCFYRTDHHWNHIGSYEGYLEVLSLLGVEDPPLVPLEEVAVPGHFSGSKTADTGTEGVWEEVSLYRFDYPRRDVTLNGQSAAGYGSQELFWSGAGGVPSYSAMYGGDMGEIIFSDPESDGEGERLLVIGESYDNAILRLLASHFDTLYSVDLRYYSAYMGQDFRLSAYLEEHDIRKVLVIGNVDCFVMDEFRLEG